MRSDERVQQMRKAYEMPGNVTVATADPVEMIHLGVAAGLSWALGEINDDTLRSLVEALCDKFEPDGDAFEQIAKGVSE